MILLNGKKDDTQVAATGHDSLTLNTIQFLGQSPLLTMVYGKHERFKWRPKKIRSGNTPHGGTSRALISDLWMQPARTPVNGYMRDGMGNI